MKRILVTGAAGFVGHHVVSALFRRAAPADRIVGIGRGLPRALPKGVAFQEIDLLDQAGLSSFVGEYRPTDILHLAALSSVQQSTDAPSETWRSNIAGLLNLADALALSAPRSNLLFVSSGEVYGRAFLDGAADETVDPRPVGAYARSKWFGEQILTDVLQRSAVRLVVLRPFNHIGPGQDERFVVPSFAGQIARIEAGLAPPVLEVGNLASYRDFLPIDDVVRAYVGVIERAERIETGTVFNICSGKPRMIETVLDELRALARVPFEVRIAPDRMRPSEIPMAVGDASRLTRATGWAPAADWTETLAAVLDDARTRVEVGTGPA